MALRNRSQGASPSLVLPILLAAWLPSCGSEVRAGTDAPPHIVVFLADDLGWNDVGYHGSEIRTPRLDALARSGLELDRFYAEPLCSPSRASLLTGRFPFRLGLQKNVLGPDAQYGLPLDERTLAEALREVGYETAIVGKWHLGHHDPAYLPTRRGFDHQYGMHRGMIRYWSKTSRGEHDWYRDDGEVFEKGYSTELITNEAVRLIDAHDADTPLFLYVPYNAPHVPLDAPKGWIDKYAHIPDEARRKYAAVVSCMDASIGRILHALDERGMTEDTLVLFASDNGGDAREKGADNSPLRGGKSMPYEGGIRVPAVISWPGRLPAGRVLDEPLHLVDLFPTLAGLADVAPDPVHPWDGLDIWPYLTGVGELPERTLVHKLTDTRASVRTGDWKVVVHGSALDEGIWEREGVRIELFNVVADPLEATDLAARYPERVDELLTTLASYQSQAVRQGG